MQNRKYVIVGIICVIVGLSAYVSEDYWRARWESRTAISETPDGELHVGIVKHNNRLLAESYNPSANTCYLRDVSNSQVIITIERCNYTRACP